MHFPLNNRLPQSAGVLQEYCPTCKRRLRAGAYFEVLKKRFV